MDLDEIARRLARGEESPKVAVRDFLSWFGAKRRGTWIVRTIRDDLAAANLQTTPDFEWEWIDAPIEFTLRKSAVSVDPVKIDVDNGIAVQAPPEDQDQSPVWVTREATYRIGRLAAANKAIMVCSPDEAISSVVTKMMKGGFSQLPVMVGERTVKGVVSWQSMGCHLALGAGGATAKDVMEAHHEIGSDRSLFDAISVIVARVTTH